MDHISRGFNRYMKQPDIRKQYEEMVQSVLNDPDVQLFLKKEEDQISQEMIQNSYSKLYEFVQEKNKLARGEQGQNPGYEPKLALNSGYIDVVYLPTPETVQREKERELRSRINAMNISKDARTATMDKIILTQDRNNVLMMAYAFMDEYTESPKDYHQGFYLYGPFGTGKTYLLGAMAHELSKRGHVITMMHYPTFTQEMKAAIADGSVSDKLNAVKNSEILMLDDIGAEVNSTWIRDEVLGVILQHRMQEKLPTFFSSNFNFSELEEHLRMGNRGDDEPIKAKRLMERIKYLAKEVALTGKNRRFD